MRFYSGSRDTSQKKGKASQMYKDKLRAKELGMPEPTNEEKYKRAIEERMAKMMEDYLLGKKKTGIALPGTKADDKDEKPKEIPKSTMLMLRMMAMKREAKERKLQKKKELAFIREEKQKKWEESRRLMFEQMEKDKKEAELKAEEEAKAAAYWNNSDPNKSWW